MSDRWLRYFELPRRDPRRDVDDEIRFHLEERIADLVRQGLPRGRPRARHPRVRRRASRPRPELAIDQRMLRRGDRAELFRNLWRDARVGFRSLWKTPTFAITAILCAALGIGVTTSIVSATYAVLIRPLPYPNAERLVAVYGENVERGYHGTNISWPDYRSWRENSRTVEALGIWTWITATLSDDATEAERVSGAWVSASLFPALGVRPLIGRGFTEEEETPGRDLHRAP